MTDHMYFMYLCINEMIRNFGLKLTNLGIEHKDNVILTDKSIMFKFLRLDYTIATEIKTDLAAYAFITSSPYFNPIIFKVGYRLKMDYFKALQPDVKSKMIRFIKYIRETGIQPKYRYTSYSEVYDKVVYNFVVRNKLQDCIVSKRELNTKLSEKLNGHLVMQWFPDVKQGALLGDMLKQFKLEIEKRIPYDVYLFNSSKETIKNDFILFFTV